MAARNGPKGAQRLDKWLWHARVFKTRALAASMVEAGKIRVNRRKIVQPAYPVSVGDTLTITHPQSVAVCRIVAIAARRGPFAEARSLYEDPGTGARLAGAQGD